VNTAQSAGIKNDKIEGEQPNCHFTINEGDAGDAAPWPGKKKKESLSILSTGASTAKTRNSYSKLQDTGWRTQCRKNL
jgi:hypothetical protein